MTETTTKPQRVLVALDPSRHSRSMLELAAALAARRNAELTALFIEDINLVHLSGLPFAREVDRMVGSERPYDTPVMSRSFRTQLHFVRQLLGQITRDTTITASVQILRGHYVREAIAAASGIDILFLCRERNTGAASADPRTDAGVSHTRSRPSALKPVWIFYDGSAAAIQSLTLADEIALSEHRQLLIVLPTTSPDRIAALRQDAMQRLETSHAPLQFLALPLTENKPDALLRALRQKGCSLMVINRDQMQRISGAIQNLLEKISCPIVLAS